MRSFSIFVLVSCLMISGSGLSAQEKPESSNADGTKESADKEKKDSEERKEASAHSISINGRKIEYTATAGTITLRDKKNEPTASVFYVAYEKKGVEDKAKRPVTFSFNGGPGSASVWLHMGLLGPRRVILEEDGSPVPPPYTMEDNEYSLLDETDLVFIDPVSTGYSRATKPEDAKNFHGVNEDISSVADFIRLYVTRNERWLSPKFIIGESYGTTRAAGLTQELSAQHRMNVNGIMLVSSVLNFLTIRFAEGNDLPYVLFLPTYTATAWYHKKLSTDLLDQPLTEVLALAETFASGSYNEALFAGDGIGGERRDETLTQYCRLTGLDRDFVDRSNLRVTIFEFTRELLRDEGLMVGRFDSRYTGRVRDRRGLDMEYDPSGEAIFSAYASTFNHYVRAELNFESDLPYNVLTGDVQPWNWGSGNSYVNVARALAESMTENPFLKVNQSNGYYDLATPYYATRYTFSHLGIDPELMKNISQNDYTAGHMMYLNLPDLKKQKADLAKFIESAVAR